MKFTPMKDVMAENALIQLVIDAAFRVHRELGPGLLESAYENALMVELHMEGLKVQNQVEVPADYRGVPLGVGYRADIVVESTLLLELKTVDEISENHIRQVLTYLKFANLKRGYIFNFSQKIFKDGIRRISR